MPLFLCFNSCMYVICLSVSADMSSHLLTWTKTMPCLKPPTIILQKRNSHRRHPLPWYTPTHTLDSDSSLVQNKYINTHQWTRRPSSSMRLHWLCRWFTAWCHHSMMSLWSYGTRVRVTVMKVRDRCKTALEDVSLSGYEWGGVFDKWCSKGVTTILSQKSDVITPPLQFTSGYSSFM